MPRGRRRQSLQPSMLASGVTAALVATGGVVTVVSWNTGSEPETFTVRAARIPKMAPPSVQLRSKPRITWQPVTISEDVGVHRYVVTRHLGEVNQVACDVPAGRRPHCVDAFAPAGYETTYTVAATHGAHWTGPDSGPSEPVTTPGVAVPISVNGVLIVPGPAGTAVVAGSAPSGGSASAGPGGGEERESAPVTEPGTPPDDAAPPPAAVVTDPVVVPPAPPETEGKDPGEPPTEPSRTPSTESLDPAGAAADPAPAAE